MPDRRDLVFFCYSHKDERWLTAIQGGLEPYLLEKSLRVWSDRQIGVGTVADDVTRQAMAKARVAVLLVSQNFFSSAYIRDIELPSLVQYADAGSLKLVCVVVKDVDPGLVSRSGLSRFQFAFGPTKSLSSRRGPQREKAVIEVCMRIVEAYGPEASDPSDKATAAASYRAATAFSQIGTTQSGEIAGSRIGSSSYGQLHGVPDLDQQHYVERAEALSDLKALLIESTNLAAGVTSTHRRGRLGLHGMGGMGKTVLAQAFCQDSLVRRTFVDGIYWLTLGQEPALLAEQTRLLEMLAPEAPGAESIAHATKLLREQVAGKRALLVIDDLWRAEHFRAFDVVSGESRVLVTTRDASVLTQIGAQEKALDVLSDAQAMSLIAEWARIAAGDLPPDAARVAKLCGHLPLALALAGAQVADGVHWATLVEQLAQGKIDFLNHDYGSVFDSLGRSIDALTDAERARYLDLAVFPEDARIPPETIARLWRHTGGLSEAEAEKLLARFHRKALLKRVQSGSGMHVSFHDLQYDFARIRAADPEVLSNALLDAYRGSLTSTDGTTEWSRLPKDEPYLWPRLAFHLLQAGQDAELRALLLNVEWMSAKLAASTAVREGRTSVDVNALLADYDNLSDDPDVSLVQRALRMSSHVLASDPAQVNRQLYGRLGTSDAPEIVALCHAAIEKAGRTPLIPQRPALTAPGALIRTLAGHENRVDGALLMTDGRRALSWSWDGTLKVWDLERGEALHTLAGHGDRVNGALLLADGRRALSWSEDRTLKVWDLERGEALHTLAGHGDRVNGALLLADGRRALSWSNDRTLKVWDLERGEALHTLAGHEDRVNGALLLADGRRALSWSEDRTLKVWDLERGEALHTLEGHGYGIGALLLADGRRALSWSGDQTLKVWDLERGEALHTLAGWLNGALLLADGRRALSWSLDRTLKVWDLERGEALHTLAGHEDWGDGALLLADGRRALSWSTDRTLKVWDLERGEALRTLEGHGDWIGGALLLADGRRALSWSNDRTLKVWDLERGEALHTLEGHGDGIGALLLTDGRRALSWSNDRTLKVWDLERGEALHTQEGHGDEIGGALLLADGRRALSWSEDRTLKVWDLERGEALHTLAGHGDRVNGVLLLADGRRALSWSNDRTLKVWDLERGETLHTLEGHGDGMGALLLADGRRALSWSMDRTLKVWDLERGEALHTLAGHEGWLNGALLLADGRRALSWSGDPTLKVWDLERGEALRTLEGHGDWIGGALLLADGRRALSWSGDRTLKVWDLERGEALRTLEGHGGWIGDALLLADGRRALSWSMDRTLKVWDLERGEALHTLEGHGDGIGALLLADGRRALSWSNDRTLKVWDLERGEALHTQEGHGDQIGGALLLADGRRALSWSDDRTLRLWSLDSAELLATYYTDAVPTAVLADEARGRIFVGDAIGHVHIVRLED